jgi:GT2 family glycosyltransferase
VVVIFIINWNGLSDTLECLDSLEKSTFQEYQVHLLDNGSTDDSWSILQSKYTHHPKIHCTRSEENLGFTKGNNLFFEQLQTAATPPTYLVLLNNDTVVAEDWLAQLVSFAERTQADLVSSKMIQYYDRQLMDNAGHYLLPTGEILPIGFGKSIDRYGRSFKNRGPCAGAGLYRWDMLRQIGLFDDYFSTGYEDAELGLRATELGYRALYCPDAVVFHKGGQSLKKIDREIWRAQTQKNILYTYVKVMPWWYIFLTVEVIQQKYMVTGLLSIFDSKYRIYREGWKLFKRDWSKAWQARRAFRTLRRALR